MERRRLLAGTLYRSRCSADLVKLESQWESAAAAKEGPPCTCQSMHDTHLYLNTATLATLDKLGPFEPCVVRVTTLALAEFRQAYVAALEAERFTEAERMACAASVFDAVLAAQVEGSAITSLASDVERFKLALAAQLRAELGVDPLRAGSGVNQRLAPEAADNPLESLQSQYGRNIRCPPADEPLPMANLVFAGEQLAKLRALWDGKERSPSNALLVLTATAGGTRSFFGAYVSMLAPS